jgi:nucleotide-binding universal stress UspA family protein
LPKRKLDAAEETATRALKEFMELARCFRVTPQIIPVRADGGKRAQPRNLPHFARAFDIVVVEQPTPEKHVFAGGLIGSIVSESGRPILAIPFIQAHTASFDNVVVAWDGSASAARALGDAIPVLNRAKSVEVVTTTNGMGQQDVPAGGDVVQHLMRHGIHATFRNIPGGIDAAEMLLSYVADTDANLMIAGAYGHPRLVETIVGGATRTLLESMTIPLLMAH